ncbi:MAG: HlyD family efflux transporter periplasmic adaptor subunit, partial [Planctomycetia bacterium]|nr:HlyD family efflux transporter periplasmic adaptor subunit [Planctomycetia bacterium]
SKSDAQPVVKNDSADKKADSQATPAKAVTPGTPADQAVEWAMSGWKTVVAHRQAQKQPGAKTWSVARAVGEKNGSGELVPAPVQTGTPGTQSQTPVPSPLPTAVNKSGSEKAQREAFLTQPPKPLPSSLRSPGNAAPSQAKSIGSSSTPAVNYGGKIAGVESGPNDIVLTDAIVEIPKGEGFEAMISACGQGLLVELGIEELGKDGKPVLDSKGEPKRISLKRGMAVRKGQILGKQNDREHAANKLVAEQQLIVAKKEAEKQLEIEVARLAVQVAESEYLRAQSANEKVPGAVSPEEVVQKAYEWKRADKSAEKAVYDLGVKSDEVEVRKAQVIAADAQVLDRKLVSPIDGFVDDVMQNEGQWLREGDNILKIIRLDKVQICGKIDANLFSPEMVDRKPVTIYVQKPGGPLQKVQGTITYARQVVESGKFYIYAEASNVANAQGYWLLNPGTIVTMVIHR